MHTPVPPSPAELADEDFMQEALQQAHLAGAAGEVPIGAVVVKDGVVVGAGYNQPIGSHDPSAHAEIVALRAAARRLGNYRLSGCTMYVTLEPCAMCAGAILQARMDRLVFGAPEPRTGAAGSVLDLFSNPQLNHHTTVQGRVLEQHCAHGLQEFFQLRRVIQRQQTWPLPDDALRTPPSRFADLPDYPWGGSYFNDLPGLDGLRMHYIDTGHSNIDNDNGAGEGAGSPTFLCLQGPGGWSYQFRHCIAFLAAAGYRVIAPDLPGSGKSDKPKRANWHSNERHCALVGALAHRLQLHETVLMTDGGAEAWSGAVAPSMWSQLRGVLALLPANRAALEQASSQQSAAWAAPFVDAGHRALQRAPRQPPNPALSAQWQTAYADKPIELLLVQPGSALLRGADALRGILLPLQERQSATLQADAGRGPIEPGTDIAALALEVFTTPVQSPTMGR